MKASIAIISLFLSLSSLTGNTSSIIAGGEDVVVDSAQVIPPDTITPLIEQCFTVPTSSEEHMIYAAKLDSVRIDDARKTILIYANDEFSFRLFTAERVNAIYSKFKAVLPDSAEKYDLQVIANGKEISEYIPNYQRSQSDASRMWRNIDYRGKPWVDNISRPFSIARGLYNRHITIWPSHGRYWLNEQEYWGWQRPALFCTTEDMFTLSIVTPFLIPMLENSGAVCYMPRERDWQLEEIIVDNDDPQSGFTATDGLNYWELSSKEGFKNSRDAYYINESPFRYSNREFLYITDTLEIDSVKETKTSDDRGSAFWIETMAGDEQVSTCCWMPHFKKAGDYAVYVTYQSSEKSTECAIYKIVHDGIVTKVSVNQTMGGGTWVYLGTFGFSAGQSAKNAVYLDNATGEKGKILSADAIRFGGGMGNTAREEDGSDGVCSGLPRFLEAARYYCHYSGLPYDVYNTKDGHSDYADDINCRSNALNWLAGGSVYVPDTIGGKVPFELSLAVHSDAGFRRDNDIYGSLVISTLRNDTLGEHFKSGLYRMASSDFADMLQQSICKDMSAALGRTWYRREHLRKNYSETRKPEVPSAILEIMSHQNFSDMLLGHDPNVKFLLARSIYKAILKYIAFQHGSDYVVHPLPVQNFAAILQHNGKVRLSWSPTEDNMEKTATPVGYVVYTKRDGMGYDNGVFVKNAQEYVTDINTDVVYSFKITAVNAGGESFPSEELTVYKSSEETMEALIVNGFTRLSAPGVVNTKDSLGFSLSNDFGVPYMKTPEYCGDQYEYNRDKLSALGRSNTDMQGKFVVGNTFNYPLVHGKALVGLGHVSFSSSSAQAVEGNNVSLDPYDMVDLILGLQKDDDESSIRQYKTITPDMRENLSVYLDHGGRLFISGAYLGSDMRTLEDERFMTKKLRSQYVGKLPEDMNGTINGENFTAAFEQEYNQETYAVQHPEMIKPVGEAQVTLNYGSGACVGVACKTGKARTYVMSVPFESIKTDEARVELMGKIVEFLTK